MFVSAIAASGVNHKTYCGEYTLLASITDARTKKATDAKDGVYCNSNSRTIIVVNAINNKRIESQM